MLGFTIKIIFQTNVSSIPASSLQVRASPCLVLQLVSCLPFLSEKSYLSPLLWLNDVCKAVKYTFLYLSWDVGLLRLHLLSCEPHAVIGIKNWSIKILLITYIAQVTNCSQYNTAQVTSCSKNYTAQVNSCS